MRVAARNRALGIGLAIGLVSIAACAPTEDGGVDRPTLRLVENRAVEVTGLSRRTLDRIAALSATEQAEILSVRTLAADADPGVPALLGDLRVDDERLLFEPRFPLAGGMSFVARYSPNRGSEPTILEFRIDEPDGAGDTRVTAVYPSADEWPMNQLKMYVHFSAPMRAGTAFEHIRLVDRRDGSDVEQPFVTVQEELWNRDRTILTVLYDPARIKRGLAPHLEAGLPLQSGGSYRLVIDATWRDAQGRPLAAPFERDFSVGEPDRASPRPTQWRIDVPVSGSRDALTLIFDEPLDHGLLHTLIGIRRAPSADGAGNGDWRLDGETAPADEIRGDVEVAEGETVWRFRPEQPWQAGSYEIVVPTILEDLAGNTLRGLFDAEAGAPATRFAHAEAAYRSFAVTATR